MVVMTAKRDVDPGRPVLKGQPHTPPLPGVRFSEMLWSTLHHTVHHVAIVERRLADP